MTAHSGLSVHPSVGGSQGAPVDKKIQQMLTAITDTILNNVRVTQWKEARSGGTINWSIL